MSNLVSNWSKNAQSLPESYIFPPDQRPGDVKVPLCQTIPLIDLSQEKGHGRAELVQQILKVSHGLGIFQVINHGVSEELMDETMSLYEELFNMSLEDKAKIYSEDVSKNCRLYTGGINYTEDMPNYWRDVLTQSCHPLEDHIKFWPHKPERYREVVGRYSVELRRVSMKIMELIGEGLGLEEGYFEGELSKNQTMVVNHYPPCPDPSSALGLMGHCDQYILTVLQQSSYGLQILSDDKWFGVEPIPYAFVVNLGDQLEIISNGKLKSAHHRVVTNTEMARTSIVNFTIPSDECVIKPDKTQVSESNPPRFGGFRFKEYNEVFMNKPLKSGGYTRSLDGYRLDESSA